MIKIYTLAHPITNEIRYIGYTKLSLNERLNKHIRDAKTRKPNHRINWINSLPSKPIIELIDESNYEDRIWMECMYIDLFISWGYRLTNTAKGGDGGDTWSKLSPENKQLAKERLSKSIKGRKNGPLTEEHKQKLRENHCSKNLNYINPCKGKIISKETKDKQRLSKLGIQFERGSSYSKIQQLNILTNEIITIFDNPIKAAESIPNTTRKIRSKKAGNIIKAASGYLKSAYKYKWQFVN